MYVCIWAKASYQALDVCLIVSILLVYSHSFKPVKDKK